VVVVAGSALFSAAYVWRVLALAIRIDSREEPVAPVPRRVAWAALALAGTTLVLGAAPGALAELVAQGRPQGFTEPPR
jgi:hypothetical protein